MKVILKIKIRYARILLRDIFNISIDLFYMIYSKLSLIKEWEDKKPLLLLVADNVSNRVEKISFALGSNNMCVGLLYKNAKNLNKTNYSFSVKFRSAISLKRIINELQPSTIHVFSSWDFNTAYYLIKRKVKYGKVVFDDYDVWSGIVNENYLKYHYLPNQLIKEQYCLKNADGLCCRSLEFQVPKRMQVYQAQKRIFFPEYMINRESNGELTKQERKKHTLVYAGNLNINIIKIAEMISDIGWRLDVYPAHHSIKAFPNLPDNITIFETVDSDQLYEVLKHYRYGLIIPPDLAEGDSCIYSRNKRELAMTGKLFDYVDAGLKVVARDYSLILCLLKRMNSLVELKGNDPLLSIRQTLTDISDSVSEEVTQSNFKNKYSLKENGKRLIHFYSKL